MQAQLFVKRVLKDKLSTLMSQNKSYLTFSPSSSLTGVGSFYNFVFGSIQPLLMRMVITELTEF
jgi:hypothetical protein